MKCNNCGTDLQPGMNICPYCRMPVNALPATPTEPTLPQDQNINIINANNTNTVASNEAQVNNSEQINNPIQEVIPSENITPQPVVTNQTLNTVQTPMNQPLNNVQYSNQNMQANKNVVTNQPVAPAVNEASTAIPTAMDQVNSKLSSYDQAPVIKKEKNKKLFKKLIIVFVVLIVISIGLYFAYDKIYNTGSIRTGNAIEKLLSRLNMMTNDDIELGNGDYTLNASLNYNDINYKTNVTGKYAYDLNSKVIDITSNINSLTYKNEELLSGTPVSNEFYMYNNIVYVLFENFLNKYIYANINEVPDALKTISENIIIDDTKNTQELIKKIDYNNLGLIFNNISQNDIDYTMLIRTLKIAFKNSANSMIVKSSFTSSNPYNKMLSVTNISVPKVKQEIFMNNLYSNLERNKTFVDEVVKLTGKTEEQVLSMLSVDKDNFKAIDDINIYVYSSLFDQEFQGMKVLYDDYQFIITPKGLGFKLVVSKSNVELLSLDYGITLENTSTTKKTTRTAKFTYYQNKIAYNGDISLETTASINPRVEKTNTKNSVKYNNLSRENYQALEREITNFGKFGLLLKDHVKYKDVNVINYCSIATNCTDNGDGSKTCNYCIKTTDASGNEVDNCNNTIKCN